jgi:hypothetical protein
MGKNSYKLLGSMLKRIAFLYIVYFNFIILFGWSGVLLYNIIKKVVVSIITFHVFYAIYIYRAFGLYGGMISNL